MSRSPSGAQLGALFRLSQAARDERESGRLREESERDREREIRLQLGLNEVALQRQKLQQDQEDAEVQRQIQPEQFQAVQKQRQREAAADERRFQQTQQSQQLLAQVEQDASFKRTLAARLPSEQAAEVLRTGRLTQAAQRIVSRTPTEPRATSTLNGQAVRQARSRRPGLAEVFAARTGRPTQVAPQAGPPAGGLPSGTGVVSGPGGTAAVAEQPDQPDVTVQAQRNLNIVDRFREGKLIPESRLRPIEEAAGELNANQTLIRLENAIPRPKEISPYQQFLKERRTRQDVVTEVRFQQREMNRLVAAFASPDEKPFKDAVKKLEAAEKRLEQFDTKAAQQEPVSAVQQMSDEKLLQLLNQ